MKRPRTHRVVGLFLLLLIAAPLAAAAGEEPKQPEGKEKQAAPPAAGPRKQAARTVEFSGHTWRVKNGRRLGPGPNSWSNSEKNVWLDDKGQLHLAIVKTDDRWDCAEVVATESLGYGEYRWVIEGDLSAFDPRVVLGMFTYENDQREIDFELSRWGDAKNPNSQFVVQPGAKDSVHRFDSGKAKTLTVSLLWEKAKIRGRCWVGEDTTQTPLADWEYTGKKNPPPGRERVDINFWLYQGIAPSTTAPQEIVIRTFRFVPPGAKDAP